MRRRRRGGGCDMEGRGGGTKREKQEGVHPNSF